MTWLVPLAVLCGASFVAAAALFFWTAKMRRGLDAALFSAAAVDGMSAGRQLSLCERWGPEGQSSASEQLVLAPPERRWTYDRDYMRAFIGAIAASEVPGNPGETWLSVYEGPILTRDIAFAVAFACFIVLAWLAAVAAWPVDWLGGWPTRLAFVFAALGAVYGVADVAEDVKLRLIFREARTVLAARTGMAAAPPVAGVGEDFDPEKLALIEEPVGSEMPEFEPLGVEVDEVHDIEASQNFERVDESKPDAPRSNPSRSMMRRSTPRTR